MRFNSPPGWPTPPPGWLPPAGWKPDPSWPPPPDGWQLVVDDEDLADTGNSASAEDQADTEDFVIAKPHGRTAVRPSAQSTQPTQPLELSQPAQSAQPVNPVEPSGPPGPVGEVASLRARVTQLEAELRKASAVLRPRPEGTRDEADVIELSDQRVLQEVGIYRYHHPLEDTTAYKARLKELEDRIDAVIKGGAAVLAAEMFTFNGSLAKGQRMVADLSKLMLRAYNAEADNCVRSLRSGNISTAKRRLDSAVAAIHRLGAIMEMRVNPEYHALRIAELELTADYRMKLQEEREKDREARALLREQRRVEAELATEKERLEKERSHYVTVLDSLRSSGDENAAAELAGRLVEIEQAIAANDYRIANIRAGYVYVISNIGAFGPGIVKVGMTRRLVPMDRVRELGDASVPFKFDVHALFFSNDAVSLEDELHKALAARRVNWVNNRREFFFATPTEVRDLLAEKVGGLLEYTEQPEAGEYFQSRANWPPRQEETAQ